MLGIVVFISVSTCVYNSCLIDVVVVVVVVVVCFFCVFAVVDDD